MISGLVELFTSIVTKLMKSGLASRAHQRCLLALVAGGLANFSPAHAEVPVARPSPLLRAATAALVLHDDTGRSVSLPGPAQRVITLMPSATETVCVLGACDRLVATDRFSDWPARVKALPKAGGYEDPAPELIASLKPDLVILSRYGRHRDLLDRLGIPGLVVDPRTLDDVPRIAELIAAALGIEAQGAAFRADWQRRVQMPATASALPLRVYFEVDSQLYSASRSTFVGELLALAGARSIVPDAMGDFPRLSAEFIIAADPQWIVLSARDADAMRARAGWSRITAVKSRQVCSLNDDMNNLMTRPGPRITEALAALRKCFGRE
jgi:iron complex transport system substrate-binding protein